MGEIIFLYLLFVVTTVAVLTGYLILPVVRELEGIDPKPFVVEKINRYLLIVVLAIMIAFLAPVMLVIWFIPSSYDQFKVALVEELKKS